MDIKNGMYDLSKGQVAAVVTYLQMLKRPKVTGVVEPENLSMSHYDAPAVDWYLALFRRVGADYLWTSRLQMDRQKLAAHLTQKNVEVWAIERDGAALGLLELEWLPDNSCELSFFGLASELIGTGVGRWLMQHAISRAYSRDIQRFFVHTCTLDSAQALAFYQRSGFTAYKRCVEVMDDPRAIGELDANYASHIPLL